MTDMHHLVQVDGVDAAAAYAAITTQDGLTGWWTSRATVAGGQVDDRLSMSFPDAPVTWDMRITTARPPVRVEWDCTGGPPGWPGTTGSGTTCTVQNGFALCMLRADGAVDVRTFTGGTGTTMPVP